MTFTTFSTCVYHQHAKNKSRHMTFTTFSTCVYHIHANRFFPILHKNITNLWNMTTIRNFTINTRWGHYYQTSTLNRHMKLLNPTENYLYGLFPQYILTDIDIWISGLEHRDKFKAAITNINPLCNPTLFAIPQELWALYHNLILYSGWYN